MADPEFTYKTYRCEWQVNTIVVDQYGKQTGVIETAPFPTYRKALDYRETMAHRHEYVKGRWVPNVDDHGYTQVEIQYKETLVP